jgi:hypothetical protein
MKHTWLKLLTSLLWSQKFRGLPDNDHRIVYICHLIFAKMGLENEPVSWLAATSFVTKYRYKIIVKNLMDCGLFDASGHVNGFEDSQLTPDAIRMRRYRERNEKRNSYGNSDANSDGDSRKQKADSSSSPTEKKKNVGSGATPEPVASPAVAMMPVKDGEEPITEADVALWESLYGRIDVRATLNKMVGYWAALPRNKRKTRAGIRKSINTWLAKDDDRAPVGAGPITSASVDEGGWEY